MMRGKSALDHKSAIPSDPAAKVNGLENDIIELQYNVDGQGNRSCRDTSWEAIERQLKRTWPIQTAISQTLLILRIVWLQINSNFHFLEVLGNLPEKYL